MQKGQLNLLRICFLLIVMIILTVFPVWANGGDVGDFLNLNTTGFSKESVRLEINGQMIASADSAQIIGGRSMVPLKTITDTLGIPVSWFDSSQIIRIDDAKGPIYLKIGDPKAHIGGRPIELDMPPTIEGGQTLVPLRFIAEALQAKIEWLPDQNLIRLSRGSLEKFTFEVHGGLTRFIFDLTGPEAYKIFKLVGPERLVVDLSGTNYPAKKTEHMVNSDLVSKLRISQFSNEPLATRAVMDLNHPDVEYQVHVLTAQKKLVVDLFRKGQPKVALPLPGQTTDPALDPTVTEAINGQGNLAIPGDGSSAGRPIAPLPTPDNVLNNKIIVIDPGHGGKNPGAIGVTGVWESDVNYDIATRVYELLQGTGAYLIMTRKADQDPGLYERADISNNARADIFVSIHADAHPKKETRGTTVYAHHNATDDNWALAWYVHNEIVKITGLESKGLRAANFVVVREPKAPAILIESAYLTNKDDEVLLKDPNFRQKIAQGIYNGILLYFNKGK